MTTVVTYTHAYHANRGTIDLCDRHAEGDDPTVARIFGPLGPVSRGGHDGDCEACDAESSAPDDDDHESWSGGFARNH